MSSDRKPATLAKGILTVLVRAALALGATLTTLSGVVDYAQGRDPALVRADRIQLLRYPFDDLLRAVRSLSHANILAPL